MSEQVAEVHDVVVIVDGIDAIVKCDKPASDHWKHIICVLTYLYVISPETAQILNQN